MLRGHFRESVPSLAQPLAQSVGQFWQYLEQVGNQSNISDLEDRRLCVLVDSDDRARILDTGNVLNSTRNSDSNIEIRGNDLAGLANLRLGCNVASVDSGT